MVLQAILFALPENFTPEKISSKNWRIIAMKPIMYLIM